MDNNSTIENSSQSLISKTSGLKVKDYVGYALGDAAGCLVFSLITSLLQKFYTDIFLLHPMFIMLMFVGARVWDAFNDPIMGRICDSIKISKWGRYRPWFLYAALPLIISTILVFTKWPGFGEEKSSVLVSVYAAITYVLFGMCYTMLQIPYGSLASVVTTDEKERSKLSIYRSIGAGLGSVPVILISSFCYHEVVYEGSQTPVKEMNYTVIIIGVIVMSIASLALLLLAFKYNKERVISNPTIIKEKGKTIAIIKNLLTNRSFIAISLTAMLLLAGQMFTQSFYLYLFDDYFNADWMNMVSMVCTYAPMVIFIFITPKVVRKFGKKESAGVGMAISAVANLIMFAVQGVDVSISKYIFMALCFISGTGQTILLLQVWSLATDAIDDIEIKTGQREDATAYSIFNLFRKLGQVIAAIAVNGALLSMHYFDSVQGVELSKENLKLMYDMATLIPAIMFGIMAILLLFVYPLGKKKLAELQIKKEEKLAEDYANNKIIIK